MQLYRNLTLLSANFNQPELTLAMLKSLTKATGLPIPVVIIDNSTKYFLPTYNTPVFRVIDNTNFKITPDHHQNSHNHSHSLEYAFSTINTRYVLLCDNDILFKPAIKDVLLQEDDQFDAWGQTVVDGDIPPTRLLPYCCIIDLFKKKADNIAYYDPSRLMLFHHPGARGHYSYMDTGCSFLQDIERKNWRIHRTDIGQYIEHLKGVSYNGMDYHWWLNRFAHLYR